MIAHRNNFGKWLMSKGLHGVGVEVGVLFGAHAEIILDSWDGTLYLVDPYVKQSDLVYLDAANNFDMELAFKEAKMRMSRFANRAVFWRMTSMEFGRDVYNSDTIEKFDFVYLDGNHREEVVAEEIRVFWPMIKKGGVLCGHDFGNVNEAGKYLCGVEAAVHKWLIENPHLHLTLSMPVPEGCDSWWVKKPTDLL